MGSLFIYYILSLQTIQHLTMAPVEIDHFPRSIIAPVKNMKVVDKAMSLPLVSSANTEVTRVTSSYMESTYNKVGPVVETTMGMVSPMVDNVKTKVEEQVMPHIPTKLTETVQTVQNYAIDNVTSAVEKVDQLKDATPKLIEETKSSVTSYVTGWTDYFASFSLSQVALKVVDSSLDLVDGALNKVGSEETGTMRSGVRMVHSTANTIRLDAVKKAGSEKAKKIEEASIIGALIEVSGLQDLLAIFGFKLKTTETVKEEEVKKTE